MAADSGRTPHLVWVYTQALAESLDAATWLETTRHLRAMGWRVTLFSADAPGRAEVRGVALTPLPRPRVYLLGQAAYHARVLWRILSRWRDTDAVLFHQISAPWLLPLRLLRYLTLGRGPALVMDTRTLPMSAESHASRRDRLRAAFYRVVSGVANRAADGRTAITARMAEAEAIPSARLWGIWPSAVDVDLFAPAGAGRPWPGPGEAVRLIYVGALHYERNLMALARAVEAANAEGLAFTLDLVGDGSERADLARYAEDTAGRVRVLPPVPHTAVPGLLREAHVGVLPFPNEHKFVVSSPIKLFEYLAAGLPILATAIPCHTDVVGDGAYAFWWRGAHPEALLAGLREVWARRGELPAMGAQAARAAEVHTWRASARLLDRALRAGLCGRRAGRREVAGARALSSDGR